MKFSVTLTTAMLCAAGLAADAEAEQYSAPRSYGHSGKFDQGEYLQRHNAKIPQQ